MATDTVVRGSYYTPPTVIRDVPGLVTVKGKWWTDFYSGTADALIAAGLLSADQFPGLPGKNSTSHSYRPIGGEPQRRDDSRREWWHLVPGYLRITRQGSGRFQIELTVSREEQARRKAARDKDDARRESLAPPSAYTTPEELSASARTILDVIVNSVGVEEVQRLLDLKPRRPRPRPNYLQLVASRGTLTGNPR